MDDDIEDLYLFSLGKSNLNPATELSAITFYVLLSLTIILAFYYYILQVIVLSRWRRCWLPILNFTKWYHGKADLCSLLKILYDSAPIGSPYIGFYVGLHPALLVVQPDVVNLVLNVDFDYFTDRVNQLNTGRICSPLMFNTIFLADHIRWQAMRPPIEPAMSTYNVRMMWINVLNCFPMLCDDGFCKRRIAYNVEKHISNVFKRIAFGIDVGNAFASDIDPEQLENITETRSGAEESIYYRNIGESSVEGDFYLNAEQDPLPVESSQPASFYRENIAWLKESISHADLYAKWYGVPEWIQRFLTSFQRYLISVKVNTKLEQYFYNISQSVLQIRERSPNHYDTDFMQLLLCLRNNGSIMDQEKFNFINQSAHKLQSNEVAEYATMVLTEGYDTISATITFCLYELAKNPEVQSKLVEELTKLSEQELSDCDVVTALPYLDSCLKETLRKYPAKPFLYRSCTKNYVLPHTNDVMMKKDSIAYVSILGIHHNPVYYPNPLQFQPDRFAEQKYEDALHYLPFGIGPRKCYGQKLAIMIMKCTLALLVYRYDIQTIPGETIEELDFQLLSFMSQIHEIKVKIARRSVPETEPITDSQIAETLKTDDIIIHEKQNMAFDTLSSDALNISDSQSIEAEHTTNKTIAAETTSTLSTSGEWNISASESKASSSFLFPTSSILPQLKLSPNKTIWPENIESVESIESTNGIISIQTTPIAKRKPLNIRGDPVRCSKETTSTAGVVKPSSFNTFNRFIPRSPTKSAKSTPTKAKEEELSLESSPESHHSSTKKKVVNIPKK